MNESTLEDVVRVPKITKLQSGEKTKTNDNIWERLPGNECLKTSKPAVPEISQVSDGANKEKWLTNSQFVAQPSDDSFGCEVSNTVGKLGFVNSYDKK